MKHMVSIYCLNFDAMAMGDIKIPHPMGEEKYCNSDEFSLAKNN